jgi:SAM-dependent methyltransferase
MVSPPPTEGEVRVRAWLAVREPLERQLAPLGRAAMAALGPRPGERILDLGCGVGATPRALAQAVGPAGEVVALDLLPEVVDVLRRDPDPPDHLVFLCGDAAAHPFEPASFDAVYSRFGVMFFPEPVSAFANLRRALRPGGRLAFVCWRRLEENELDHLPLRAAGACLPPELVADTERAGWFSFSDEDAIRQTLVAAGFVDLELSRLDQPVGSGDLRAMTEVCSHVGALGAILRRRPDLRARAVPALEKALRERDGPGGPTLGAAVWIVSGRTPL